LKTYSKPDIVDTIRFSAAKRWKDFPAGRVGCIGVSDAARWYVSHPAEGQFDWTWPDQVVTAAEKHNPGLYPDLWHYGYPDWLVIMSADAPRHFAEFAREIARGMDTSHRQYR
jgi:GH35 family endo-1,4-beta-xylanase